jgi:transcriptional regulator with XRE-family HTH domain
MTIGARVRERRLALGLSQEQLARRADVGLNAVHRLEMGQTTDPHYSTLEGLAHALGITVADLVQEPAGVGKGSAPPETGPDLQQTLESARKVAQPLIEQDDQTIADYRQALARMKDGIGVSDARFIEEGQDLSPEAAEMADLMLEQELRRRRLTRS